MILYIDFFDVLCYNERCGDLLGWLALTESLQKEVFYLYKVILSILVAATIFVVFFGIGAATAPGPNDDDVVPASTTTEATEEKVTTKTAEESTVTETTRESTEDYSDLKVDVTVAKAAATQNPEKKSVTSSRSVTSSKKKGERQAEVPTAAEQPKTTTAPLATDSDTKTESETVKPEETTKVEEPTTKEADKPKTEVVKSSSGTVQIADDEYYYICCLVYGEAGAEPYDGQILVAQCFYNAMAECGKDAYSTAKAYGYTGSTKKGTNESVKKAVAAVFYDGYRYTDEPVLFFYSPRYMKNHWSSWHESQTFVCEVGGHRFFKRNGA